MSELSAGSRQSWDDRLRAIAEGGGGTDDSRAAATAAMIYLRDLQRVRLERGDSAHGPPVSMEVRGGVWVGRWADDDGEMVVKFVGPEWSVCKSRDRGGEWQWCSLRLVQE